MHHAYLLAAIDLAEYADEQQDDENQDDSTDADVHEDSLRLPAVGAGRRALYLRLQLVQTRAPIRRIRGVEVFCVG